MAESINEVVNRAWTEGKRGGDYSKGYYQGVRDSLAALGYTVSTKTTLAVEETTSQASPSVEEETLEQPASGYFHPLGRLNQFCRLTGVFRDVISKNGGRYTLYRFLSLPQKQYQFVFNIHDDVLSHIPVGTNVFIKGEVIRHENVNGLNQNVVKIESIWSEDRQQVLWEKG